MTDTSLDIDQIRRMRDGNPKMRERDLAKMMDISEAELVAAFCGETVRRIDVRFDTLFPALEAVGEVLALTRNESAVHEKVGVYDRFIDGKMAAMMLGADIDMRMFPAHWVHGFAVDRPQQDGAVRRSLQVFDRHGDAVHKIHAREATDIAAWDALVTSHLAEDQTPGLGVRPEPAVLPVRPPLDTSVRPSLRAGWAAMTDPHQFHGLLRKFKLHRLDALELAGEPHAWQLQPDAVSATLRLAANEALPIMCFVGSRGCIQIHSGPVESVALRGPWINVMDPGFHLHLRTDQIREAWAVRKPTAEGHVTSIEAYDADGTLVIQFFGLRKEGADERGDWRALVENLPRLSLVPAQ